ncbi:hypothetical protein DLAC_05855 [Tieghemostelium lacteum]|uniref:Ribosomal protein S15 n=1 Tax=Tieghemostelium lacteum TaxID=361077 RepID=A0A151ZH25_TIELA|nr:hypothetical protein DLAC_05855 [Tieghemostelium lacteum]|eukprot:KYQ93217.1 hypothetical protein DLAC_05855 [Tieghemostelium lacteum]
MLRLLSKSITLTKTYQFTKNCKFYSSGTSKSGTENVKINLNEFEKFKVQKEILDEIQKEIDYEYNGGEKPTTQSKLKSNSEPNLDFIASEMNHVIGEKSNRIKDFMKQGYKDINMTQEETKYAFLILEEMLRQPNGRAAVNGVLADLASSFGLEPSNDLEVKYNQLKKEFDLKLGQDIEEFIKQNPDEKKINPQQRQLVSDYLQRHPYLKHANQTQQILDLIDLSSAYKSSSSEDFGKKLSETFNIQENSNSNLGQPLDEINQIRDQGEFSFIQDSNKEFNDNQVVDLVKTGALSFYFQQLVENAKQQSNPASNKLLEQQKKTEEMLNKMDEREYREEMDYLNAVDELNKIKRNDQLLSQEYSISSNEANEKFGLPKAQFLEEEESPESQAEQKVVTDVIPELDMILPENVQEQAPDPRDLLKYYYIYPKQVRKWIDYTHTPQGYFTNYGVWYNLPTWYSELFKPTPPDNYIAPKGNKNVFKQPELPDDLKNAYRFGVTEEEIKHVHPKLKEFLSFRNASQKEVTSYRKQQCISKYGDSPLDTGKSSVQIAILTEKINTLKAHIDKNHKDNLSKRSLMITDAKRKSMIEYLKRKNIEEYYKITKDLKIKNY